MAADIGAALAAGIKLGLAYNPMTAVLGAAVAAGLLGVRKPGREKVVWAVSTLAITWLVGDGMRAIARARDVYDGVASLLGVSAPAWIDYLAIGVWAAVSLAVGYAFATWAGAFVGRRVTHGTGWVAAITVAVGASLAVSALVAGLSG